MQVGHAISSLYIFKKRDEVEKIFKGIVEKFSLKEYNADSNHKFYSNESLCIEWLTFNGAAALHVLVEKQDSCFKDNWQGCRSSLEQIIKYPEGDGFIGASIMYWGFPDVEIDKRGCMGVIENEVRFKPEHSTELERGTLTLLKDYDSKSKKIEYAFISKKPAARVSEFILGTAHPLIPVELSAHIQRDQIKHYKNHRDELLEFMEKLDKEAIDLLKVFNIKSSEHQQEKLDNLSKKYSGFVGMVAWANKILNTAQIDFSNYRELVNKIPKQEDEIFERQLKKFGKEIEQVRYDLNYCDSTIKNINTGLELLRGCDSTRMQKQGLVQQTALAVIEVVFVFYYSLGVWHFVIDEHIWERIYWWGKLVFGIALAVGIPLFAHFLVEKKHTQSIVCLVFILIAMVFAVWLTITASALP